VAEALAPTPVPAGPMVPARYRVGAVRRELHDVVTLHLEALDEPLPPFRAGQFHMIWAFGTGEVPISVSGDPTAGELQHTIRAVGPSTRSLCALAPGDVVGLRGPFGRGWDVGDARGGDLLLVAGGVGLAPLRPALLEALAGRARYGTVALVVGARSPEELLFAAELGDWAARDDLDVHVTVDHARPGWPHDVGVVTQLLGRTAVEPSRTTALVCGPEIMMRYSAMALVDMGIAPGRVRVSLERNMRCAVAHCGHCQLGPALLCRDGPVLAYDTAGALMAVRGL
jgi:anaerobic sulfite reductase subunit B